MSYRILVKSLPEKQVFTPFYDHFLQNFVRNFGKKYSTCKPLLYSSIARQPLSRLTYNMMGANLCFPTHRGATTMG